MGRKKGKPVKGLLKKLPKEWIPYFQQHGATTKMRNRLRTLGWTNTHIALLNRHYPDPSKYPDASPISTPATSEGEEVPTGDSREEQSSAGETSTQAVGPKPAPQPVPAGPVPRSQPQPGTSQGGGRLPKKYPCKQVARKEP